ncbi:cellulase family glycosylhydrolase [Microvirga pudoricolor]|uniref:cellulase family glycosylhydrolase n=1 Tax=Microvirga pudoricolor TaxID=2778729 RepID=UPI00194FF3E4|nr:cellulase family glycosylhydrolase [Microvirga pudoricolor]MBM6593209.1 cellulase family glycosylhydrolase [Microvirga pudoricolor]
MSNFLSTRGNQIVDGQGRTVKISGVNWFGMESDRYAPDGLHARNYKDMMTQMADLGFNTIRLPFSDQLFEAGSRPRDINYGLNPDLSGLTGLQIMDKVVAYAGTLGLKVILDHHRSAAGSGPNANGLWYDGAYTEQKWIDNWKMLAVHYAGNDTVIGADLHNEPHGDASWGGGGSTDWAAAAERAGNAILASNPNWLVFVEGVEEYQNTYYWWGGNLMGVKDRPIRLNVGNKLVYSAHDYPNSIHEQPWFNGSSFADNLPAKFDQMWGYIYKNNIAPVYIGELGTRLSDHKDKLWLDKIKSYLSGDFDADGRIDIAQGLEGIGWTWWSWNPNSGDTGGILADDWNSVLQNKMSQISGLLWTGQFPRLIVGTSGDDELTGTSRADDMDGLAGNDRLYGGDGDDDLDGGSGMDYMAGGRGNDTYHVDHAGDGIAENAGEGQDTVLTQVNYRLPFGQFIENLTSASAGLTLIGNELANTLTGDAGSNLLDGGAGADILQGLGGNDTYLVDNALDVVIEAAGGGYDVVRASASVTLPSSSEVELLTVATVKGTAPINLTGSDTPNMIVGNDGPNVLAGAGGNDTIYAGSGNDRVNGGAGHDMLFGQWGKDVLTGGGGRDVFVFDSKPHAANVDRIVDFVVRDDSIYLENSVFKALGKKGSLASPAHLKKEAFFAGSAAHDASDRILYDKKTGVLWYDKDGTGSAAAVKIAQLSKNLKIKATDFFVI